MTLKVCIYTVIIDNYDFTLPPVVRDSGVDYLLFSDGSNVNVEGWEILSIAPELRGMPPSTINRHYKILPHKYLRNYDVSIYIDGNIRIVGSVWSLIDDFMVSNTEIGLFKHPLRSSVKEEVIACVQRKKVKSPDGLKQEYQAYSAKGFLDKVGLTENNVIIRKHNDNEVVQAMEMWWLCLKNGAGRDQISLPYVREKMRMKETIYHFNARVENPYFKIYPHRTGEKLKDVGSYLYAKGLANTFYCGASKIYSFIYRSVQKVYFTVYRDLK